MLQCCPHTLIDKWSPDVQCANTATHCSSFPNHKTSLTLWVVMKLVIIIIIIIHTLFLPTRSHMQRDWLSLRCVKSLHLPWCHLEISSSSALTPVQSHVRCGLIKSDWRLSHFRVRGFGWVILSTAAGLREDQMFQLQRTDSSVLSSSLCFLLHFSFFLFSFPAVWRSDFSGPPHCNALFKPF